ncbi:signal peptide peptidase SppA [Biformimicrobium ophioploci]|uniref:Signal peptide peptidase SppA n=1 Tax=Biformimicrobium ophioploci TaxID=3036711 RepID=A0ABQ6M2Q1_9GAMM|nr:signal peptide peptidase SppA [Microbulbifer sp. NKW57]GMG88550.1 signal peptide peptidase SppA [Microbulbifer sp. NKW57]
MTESDRPKKGLIRRFFGGIWHLLGWLRTLFANLIFLLILLLIGSVLFGDKEDPYRIPDKGALRIAPSGVLVDELTQQSTLPLLLGAEPQQTETRVKDLVDAIDHAAGDARINAIVMELDSMVGGSLSKLEEIGAALQKFKKSGKPIYAIADNYTQSQYYLASHADQVYLNPMGSVLLTGFGAFRNYYKSALEKLKINFHVFRVGDYKDFVEPFLRDDMSPASRENNQRWLNALWTEYAEHVSTLRDLPADSIDKFIHTLPQQLESHAGSWAEAAKSAGLVDDLSHRRQVVSKLQKEVGKNKDGDSYQSIEAINYIRHIRLTSIEDRSRKGKIGLVTASGSIVDGKAPPGQIGSATLVQRLYKAQKEKVNAVVLRIDSGGGSSFASEEIRQAVLALRNDGIPVIMSMGSVAASGGYWIAAGADKIWASPSTITGSIGVFGAFPTFEESLEHIGIYNDGVGTSKLAGAMRLDRPLSPMAESLLQQGVENTYARFLALVAEARNSTPEEIDKIAQGQVWTGRDAKQLGLVDELGGLQEAIADAAQIAELEDYRVVEIERDLNALEKFLRTLNQGVDARIEANLPLLAWLQNIDPALASGHLLSTFNDPRAIYARCLDCAAP